MAPKWLQQLKGLNPTGSMRALLVAGTGPLELGMFSRTLLLAAGVGVAAGLVGAAFVASVDAGAKVLLEQLAGVSLVRAIGEAGTGSGAQGRLSWWLLVVPAGGALLGGLVSRLAPGAYGGGGAQTIATYHAAQATVRPILLPVKFIASVATLSSGGAGGREGPAMQLGSSVGAILAEILPTTPRERRLMFVAGIGAGISAVFRTPLGAALLAVEVLYRDDFDGEALVPSVLASVVSYAVATSILGARPLFGPLPLHPFVAAHLPLYAALAVVVAAAGAIFVWALHGVRDLAEASPLPRWGAPAAGGLILGLLAVGLRALGAPVVGPVPVESAFLGGGYGLAQLAVTGMARPSMTVALSLLALAGIRTLATALTVGSGGSAGDFAPALVVGGLVGSAFGHAAATLFPGSGIQPASFALVGMATLYGGVAHVPLSAVVLVSELAASYDLLVPLMLGTVGAHVLLRRVRLYESQQPKRLRAVEWRWLLDSRGGEPVVRADDRPRSLVTLHPSAPLADVVAAASSGQPVIPVVEESGTYVGLIDGTTLLAVSADRDLRGIIAADLAGPAIWVEDGESLRAAVARLVEAGISHAPILRRGRIIGLLALSEVMRTALGEVGA